VSAGSEQTEPAVPAPPTPPSEPAAQPVVGPSMAAFGGNESCPNCGARMAADQRYCLNCGHRRGEPRLPFMDAVVFMESMNGPGGSAGTPPPPPPAQSGGSNRWNANAALIAGVATLVLAIGVGFLIGRSGHENSAPAAAAPQVIKVEGGGGGGTAEAPTTEESTGGGATANKPSNGGGKAAGKSAKSPKPSKVKEGSKEEAELAKEKTAAVLHTEEGVEFAEPEQKVGGACVEGTAGCKGKEFTGEFFGE
jgi:hypothetical protein